MRGFKDEIIDCFPRNERGIAIPLNIDIDGTVIKHGYDLTEDKFIVNGNAPQILKRWVDDYNCTINIYTTREGKKEQEAINLFKSLDIPFETIGGNKQQERWTSSKKQYGFVIDDMSAVKVDYDENGRAYVDWDSIVEVFEPRLVHMHNLIKEIENEYKESKCVEPCIVQRTV